VAFQKQLELDVIGFAGVGLEKKRIILLLHGQLSNHSCSIYPLFSNSHRDFFFKFWFVNARQVYPDEIRGPQCL
jgi:hypothetical protein